ncbi:MAG: 16S rRNA (cytosine(1402)-N(4))-methyltransferase RsmH [Bacillota bacterium]|nr:16S rRNA (cytosine(1402)-N(4))-methyltransferase RsmH [Bacillota bacterium]HHU60692.1 16S rRNA (cytosine(1402)-N(4))-methyltransferase RsmH [Natronincola sp.]
MQFTHESVLLEETIQALKPKAGGIYVDCTLGMAGHSKAVLASKPGIRLIGIDQDEEALERAENQLKAYREQVTLVHGNFRDLKSILQQLNIPTVTGVLMDIGVSSPQLDDGERGFSYHQSARLDMRMDLTNPLDAWTIVNTYDEDELTKIISEYGEERWSKRISQFIVTARMQSTIETTEDLVNVIKKAIPAGAREGGPHPARRTFQALRIAVNDELGALKSALTQAVEVLDSLGRLAVITFHSLEDRIVKNYFQSLLGRCECPPNLPMCVCGQKQTARLVNRKPITASEEELESNPRSRSAKLRVIEKF